MNVLINLISIKSGGGQQVATNFVNQIIKDQSLNVTFLVTKDTYIHKLLIEKKLVFIAINNDVIHRFYFQKLSIHKIVKRFSIDLIYTMFGPGLYSGKTLSITGTAYSNIFFPEIDFWSGYSFIKRAKLKIIDFYRLKSTLKADAIVFENEAMRMRAISLFKYPELNTKLILPSISEYEIKEDYSFNRIISKINTLNFNILLLSGWHRNKNIEIVPQVLSELNKMNVKDVSFCISVDETHPESIKLKNRANELGVSNNLVFLGKIDPHNLPILFEKIDAIGLFSLLESFSNNIIEAWYFKKPLFISDAEWSRSICKDAVVYVDRNNPRDIGSKILSYRNDTGEQKKLENRMVEVYSSYPSPQEKVKLQVEFIKEMFNERNS